MWKYRPASIYRLTCLSLATMCIYLALQPMSSFVRNNLEHLHIVKEDTIALSNITFAAVLQSPSDITALSVLLCRLQETGQGIDIVLVSGDPHYVSHRSQVAVEKCLLPYSLHAIGANLPEWLSVRYNRLDVLLSLSELAVGTIDIYDLTHIQVPRSDLLHCEWMHSLSMREWKSWHAPQVDISVITNDRPKSLQRLLHSLTTAHYFGDVPDIRINLDRLAGHETFSAIDNFIWNGGHVFLHHRVITGGLLSAVVESWYPRSNHTYGVLLEDDIEVSPLFYAWIKMSLLRYRYGAKDNTTPLLFGVSLYQQKHLELLPGGRKPFDARTLFARHSGLEPSTPYLSQIPCSWGAVYFPEHWREFHDYLSIRLSEERLKIDAVIVPEVRSNDWVKSWKKYFIELVYLRGYFMLYPNFENYTSLSTNHLEIGSHVKNRSQRKQDLFLLPLIQDVTNPNERNPLLHLPNGHLPTLKTLPVLDLSGAIVTGHTTTERGRHRRIKLFGCKTDVTLHNAKSLMCM